MIVADFPLDRLVGRMLARRGTDPFEITDATPDHITLENGEVIRDEQLTPHTLDEPLWVAGLPIQEVVLGNGVVII